MINFNIYERLINAVTNFFSDWKENIKFLVVFGLGLFLSIILCSGIILYLITNYKFITMMFFIGLIFGGTYNFGKKIEFNWLNVFIIIIIILLFLFLTLNNFESMYVLKNNIYDFFIFFLSGVIEIFASIVPGISGTSLLMIIGVYDQILMLIANAINFSHVVSNIGLYISYSLGMIISFIINTYLISYLFKKHRSITYAGILGLSIASILTLLVMTFKSSITIMDFIIGIMLLTIGLLISSIMDK